MNYGFMDYLINAKSAIDKSCFYDSFKAMLCVGMVVSLTNCNQAPNTQEIPDEHRFRKVVLTEETMDPTAIAVSDDGDVFFTEDFGT